MLCKNGATDRALPEHVEATQGSCIEVCRGAAVDQSQNATVTTPKLGVVLLPIHSDRGIHGFLLLKSNDKLRLTFLGEKAETMPCPPVEDLILEVQSEASMLEEGVPRRMALALSSKRTLAKRGRKQP